MRSRWSAKSTLAVVLGVACLMLASFVLGATVNGYRVTRDLIHSAGSFTSDDGETRTTTFFLYGRYDCTAGYLTASILAAGGIGSLLVGLRLRRAANVTPRTTIDE